jgi:RNA polymerase sigma-70 factor (ECF subfamily)
VSPSAQLLGNVKMPSQDAIKVEQCIYVQEALNSMDPIDSEVLALKHFEQLSTSEIA